SPVPKCEGPGAPKLLCGEEGHQPLVKFEPEALIEGFQKLTDGAIGVVVAEVAHETDDDNCGQHHLNRIVPNDAHTAAPLF
ncbi:MAG: hypothetical protein WA354_15345, partial [Terracidiphilus sp.]